VALAMTNCIECGKEFDFTIKWDYDSPAICQECEDKQISDWRKEIQEAKPKGDLRDKALAERAFDDVCRDMKEKRS